MMRICPSILLLVLAAYSCTTAGPDAVRPGEDSCVDNVVVSDDPDNILRKHLAIDLDREAPVTVEYWKPGEDRRKRTVVSEVPSSHHEMTLIIMEPESDYVMRVSAGDGWTEKRFSTGRLPAGMLQMTDLLPEMTYSFDGLIHLADKASGTLYLINDKGKVVWYEPTDGKSVISSSYDSRTRSFQAIVGFNPDENFTGEFIYVVDLYGNVLMKKYFHELENPYFHHDISMLPDGNIMLINQVREEFDLTAAGGSASETVCGDGISFMDLDGNVYWEWSAFDVISPEDDPDIMEHDPAFQYPGVDDWLHANSLTADVEGNLYISFNKLSQVWKISPEGKVIYRLGKDGDISADDPASFSDRQHSVSVTDDGTLMIFDNGYSSGISRAVSYRIDESAHTSVTDVCFELIPEDFSPNQSSVYQIDGERFLYASTVAQNVAMTDRFGNLKWRYHSSAPMFRAIYIEGI